MKGLKHLSDALLLLSLVLLVVAVLGPSWAYWVAGFCLLGSVVATWQRRRSLKTARAQRKPAGA